MRIAMIMGLLALLLGGVFYFFVMRSPTELAIEEINPQATTRKIVPSTLPALDSSIPVGRSDDVWAKSIDAKTGRVVNEFTSSDVIPRPDGSVDVVKPRARFYSGNDAMVTLEGSEGHVFYTQAGAKNDTKALGTSSPTSGDLKDVTIRFFEKSTDTEPMFTVVVPAVRFDSNSNRVSTIDCVVNGQGYAAEQVPVTMRGRDFDFDGQGLTVAWNDREGLLDQLEILRGNRLLVRDVSKFIGDKVVTATPVRHIPSLASAMFGIVMVEETAKPAAPKNLYHATFDRDVHVIKNGEEIATGDVMRCVIPLGDTGKKSSTDENEPTTKRVRPRADRTTRPAESSATTASTTQPQPLEIRWTGKLTVRPARIVPDAPQTQMVELVGSPARVSDKDTYAVGRLIHVEPDAGRVRIEPGGSVRAIEIKDGTGTELRSRSPLVIDEGLGLAIIEGGGALNVPPGKDQKSPLQMTWAKKLTIGLSKSKPSSLEKITVDGEAKVDSDRLKLDCESLELAFDAPASAADAPKSSRFSMPSPDLSLLRRVHARGDAVCKVGVETAQRILAAQAIQLGFEAGDKDALLNSILCDGQVTLVDGDKLNLEAGNLSVQTRPISLSKSSGLEGDFFDMVTGLAAQRSVKIKRADGSSLEGDDLDLSGIGESQRLTVSGSPALLQSAKGSLSGDHIELDPATGDIRVPTAGRFSGTNPDRAGTDVAIGWTESMNVVGKTGECDFVGTVRITGHDEKGSEIIANAKHGTMQFALNDSTSKPAEPGLAGIKFESIKSLLLDGGVNLDVKTSDQRSSSMETESLAIDLQAGTMLAPQSGRMLMIDQRKKPEGDKSKSAIGPGALAMQWQDRLNWDMRGGNLALIGAVRVGFERAGSDDPVRINCDRLNGTLTPLETSNGFDQMTPKIDLKMLRAEGHVTVRSKGAKFDSHDLVYDLITQRAAAHGTDTQPVEVLDDEGTSRIGFSSITWNLETGLIEDFRDVTGQIRR